MTSFLFLKSNFKGKQPWGKQICLLWQKRQWSSCLLHSMVILSVKMTVMKWSIEWLDLITKMSTFEYLHLHEIVVGLYFHCSLFVCVCMCVCVCVSVSLYVCLIACEQNSSRTDTQIWTWFSLNSCLQWLKNLLKSVTLGHRLISQWRDILFFFIILCYFPCSVSQVSYVCSKWYLVCSLNMPCSENVIPPRFRG